jgi:type IV secretion/conjugal transfer VirB4 family ATPase
MMWLWIVMLAPVILCVGVILSIDRPYNLRWLRSRGSHSFATAVPYDYIAADGVIACEDNRLVVTWQIEGPDLINLTYSDAAAKIATWNEAVRRRDAAWCISFDDFREESRGYPSGNGAVDPTTATMAWARAARYNKPGQQFRHEHFMTATYRPPSAMVSALEKLVLDKRALATSTADDEFMRAMDLFNTQIAEFEDHLRPILRMQRLSGRLELVDGTEITFDEQLQFINRCTTGDNHRIIRPEDHDARRVLTNQDMVGGWWPSVGDKFVAVVAIEDTPTTSMPGQLDLLHDLPISYRRTTRIVFLSNEEAKRRAKGSYYRNRQAAKSMFATILEKLGAQREGEAMIDPASLESAQSSQEAYGDVTRGFVKSVLWSTKIVFMEEDKAKLNALAKRVKSTIQAAGFTARIEHLNATEAFVATFPGDVDHDESPLHMDSINAGDLAPIGSVSSGTPANPNPMYQTLYGDKPPPLVRMLTYGQIPYDLCATVVDVQHLFITGATGGGKSTLLNGMIAAQFEQYPGSEVFFFDQGRSAERYCRASGGYFYENDPATATRGFCPLSGIHDPNELNWAVEWIVTDLLKPQGLVVEPTREKKVREALVTMIDQDEDRSLSVLQYNMRVLDPQIAEALEYFTVTGPLGVLLDSREDTMVNARFQVFEMETLMRMKDERATIPLLHYIFHRIETRMNGANPTIIALDESPDYLKIPTFSRSIVTWLDKIRKKNGGVWLTTLRLNDFMSLPIADTIIGSCKTKIYLPNPNAAAGMFALYERAGCSFEDASTIATSTEKRHIYVKQGEVGALLNTDFDPVELDFIGGSSPDEVKETGRLYKRHGRALGREILRSRHRTEAVAVWDRYAKEFGWFEEGAAASNRDKEAVHA